MAASKFSFGSNGIGELLRHGRLVVPPNQRSAWEDRHVQDLLQDLAEAITNDDDEYFLGTIVLIEPRGAIPPVADGQQRLVTVSVMLARIRDRLHQIKREASAGKVDGDYLRSVDMETEERLARLTLNLEDNEYFRRYILSSPIDAGFNLATRPEEAIRPSNKRLCR